MNIGEEIKIIEVKNLMLKLIKARKYENTRKLISIANPKNPRKMIFLFF